MVASLNPVVLPPLQGGCPVPTSGLWTGSWSLSRLSAPITSITPTPSSGFVLPPLKHPSLIPFLGLPQRLCMNGVVWKRLQHPNVLSFLGFCSVAPPFSLVYPWMSNGNLSDYVRENPSVNKLGLVGSYSSQVDMSNDPDPLSPSVTGRRLRVDLPTQVSPGSRKLDSSKSQFFIRDGRGLTTSQRNVLVDNDGTACISEYGLGIVLRDAAPLMSSPTNIRWMAPEVLSTMSGQVPPKDGGKAADVYSFAIVMFEVSCFPHFHPNVYLNI